MCRVNIGHLRVTVGHCRSLEVTRGNHRLNIGQFRLTPGHLIGQLRVGKGYLMVIVGQQGSLLFFLQVNLRKT